MGEVVASVTFNHAGETIHRGDVFDIAHELYTLYPSNFAVQGPSYTPLGYPVGVKMKGANVTIKAAHAGSWNTFWSSGYDASWIETQCDKVKAIGGNTVRLIGPISAVLGGTITLAVGLARYRAFLDYAASKGLYVFATCGDLGHVVDDYFSTGAFTPADLDVYRAFIRLFDTHPAVTCIDLDNEFFDHMDSKFTGSFTTYANMVTLCTPLYNAAKAITTKKCTFSKIEPGNDSDATTLLPIIDFWAWQKFNVALDWRDTGIYYAYKNGRKPIVYAEYGVSQDQSAENQQAFLASMVFQMSRPDLMGGCYWAVTDQSATSSSQYGLYSASFVERTTLTALFKRAADLIQPGRIQINMTGGDYAMLDAPANTIGHSLGFNVAMGAPMHIKVTLCGLMNQTTSGDLAVFRCTRNGVEMNGSTGIVVGGYDVTAGGGRFPFLSEWTDYVDVGECILAIVGWKIGGTGNVVSAAWTSVILEMSPTTQIGSAA